VRCRPHLPGPNLMSRPKRSVNIVALQRDPSTSHHPARVVTPYTIRSAKNERYTTMSTDREAQRCPGFGFSTKRERSRGCLTCCRNPGRNSRNVIASRKPPRRSALSRRTCGPRPITRQSRGVRPGGDTATDPTIDMI
jgi:hypothetical protein